MARSGSPPGLEISEVDLISRELRVNHQIRVREVRVVGADGEQLGIMPIQDALRLAEQSELDLVEIAPQSRPPVCKLMDFGRFKYEQSKREKENRKKSKSAVVKELRMSPKTDRHDYEVKVRSAERFLRDGDRVKVTVRFRGREIVHSNLARERLLGIAEALADVCMIDRPPYMEGRQMAIILAPKKAGAKDAGGDSRAERPSQKEVVVSAQTQDA